MIVESIKNQIKKLVELQKIDVDIFSLKRELTEKPAVVEELKKEFELKKIHLKELEDKLKILQVDQKGKELELKSKEDSISKADGSLLLLKSNKEYQAKLMEIESLKADKSIIEEKILLSYDEIEDARKKIDQEKIVVAQEEKKYLDQKKQVEEFIALTEDKIKKMDILRREIIPGVNPEFLSRYERILNNRDGIAMVPVRNHSCGGCFMNVPAQVVNDIKTHERLILCEMCARILYLEEEVSA